MTAREELIRKIVERWGISAHVAAGLARELELALRPKPLEPIPGSGPLA